MRSLDNPLILREIIMDHYQNPRNHGLVDEEGYKKVNMNSETCIDNIDEYREELLKKYTEA